MHATDIIKAVIDDITLEPNRPIVDVVQSYLQNAEPEVRLIVNNAVNDALLRPAFGQGELFQLSVLENAQATINRLCIAKPTKHISHNKERNKRYSIGDTFNITATLGLQPVKKNSTSCQYQFSRRTNRAGIIDVLEGTEVAYAGSSLVYDDEPSSKRMIFIIKSGTHALLDGKKIMIHDDVHIAGVVNHIDPDEEYNVKLKSNASKRADKAALRARVLSSKK